MDLTNKDVHWCMSDTGWAKAAWSNFFAPWIFGASVFVVASPKFDPVQTLKVSEKINIYPFSFYNIIIILVVFYIAPYSTEIALRRLTVKHN